MKFYLTGYGKRVEKLALNKLKDNLFLWDRKEENWVKNRYSKLEFSRSSRIHQDNCKSLKKYRKWIFCRVRTLRVKFGKRRNVLRVKETIQNNKRGKNYLIKYLTKGRIYQFAVEYINAHKISLSRIYFENHYQESQSLEGNSRRRNLARWRLRN